jgi:hypothetical protein
MRAEFDTKLLDILFNTCRRTQDSKVAGIAVALIHQDHAGMMAEYFQAAFNVSMALSFVAAALFWRHARNILGFVSTLVAFAWVIVQSISICTSQPKLHFKHLTLLFLANLCIQRRAVAHARLPGAAGAMHSCLRGGLYSNNCPLYLALFADLGCP